MDKQKEIEEMRQVMAEYSCGKKCTPSCEKRGYCHIERFIENLIDNGYGNVKQAVKEFAEKLKERVKFKEVITTKREFNVYREVVSKEQIDELIKKLYGEEL